MPAIKAVTFFITILLLSINAFGNDLSPGSILKEVADSYKSIKIEGTISNNGAAEFTFSILFKKPNLYLITWKQTNAPPEEDISITAWNYGTQPYMYFRMSNSYAKITSDEMVFHIIRVMLGPELLNFPSLFLPTLNGQEKPFSWLKNPKVEKSEKIGEEDCYVISGSSGLYKREVLWVSKSRHLVRKYYYSHEPPEGGLRWPGMTDEDLKKEIKREELWERNRANGFGFHIELFKKISSPELNKDDFVFALPEGAVRNDDRFTNWGPILKCEFHGINK